MGRPSPEGLHTALGGGPHAEDIPPAFKELAFLLQEVFSLPKVFVTSLLDVTSKYVYAQFTSSLRPPKVESRHPDLPWRIACARLASPSLPATTAEVVFSLLHNVLSPADSPPLPVIGPVAVLPLLPWAAQGCRPLFQCLPLCLHHLVFPDVAGCPSDWWASGGLPLNHVCLAPECC